MQVHLPQGQAQWLRMWFLAEGISAANTRSEKFRQAKLTQLTGDTVAIAAGDEAKSMSAAQPCEDPARTGHQLRPMLCIMRAPQAVRIIPPLSRQTRGAINVIPVRRVVLLKLVEPPRDAHRLEHSQVGGGVGVVGIDERAVPVEENSFHCAFSFQRHRCSD